MDYWIIGIMDYCQTSNEVTLYSRSWFCFYIFLYNEMQKNIINKKTHKLNVLC